MLTPERIAELRAMISQKHLGAVAATEAAFFIGAELIKDSHRLLAAAEENAGLRTALGSALDLCDELRCYTHDWDWKYGERWDKDRAALAPKEPNRDDPV